MLRRRLLLAAALAPLVGCASAAPPPPREGTIQTPVRLSGGGTGSAELRTTTSTRTETATINAPPDRAYQALLNAFAVLTLTPNTLSPTTFEVGVVDARVRRALGRDPLSRFLNCGDNVNTGPNANTYDVVLSVRSRLEPVAGDSAHTTLATLVTASARPLVNAGNTLTCGSTGLLERRLVQNVQAQLTGTR